MKTNELEWRWVYVPYLDMPEMQAESALKAGYAKVYYKSEVDSLITEKDKAIAELKSENEQLNKKLMPCLNGDCILTCEVVEKYGKENAELKQKLEDAKATAYAESVDAGMRERRLRRALYKACANWAILKACLLDYFRIKLNAKKWERMHHKCLAKAEEYK